MANVIISPNMNLPVPIVGQELGPQYATDVNNSLNIIDGHTHQLGSGIPITPLGLNINSDLSAQSNNLNLVRSVRLLNGSTVLSGPGDFANVYVVNGNLYYNNAAGIPVQITNGTQVNTTSTASNNYPQSSAASNFSILASASYIELLVDSTGGAHTITMPAANAVAIGRFFIIKDILGNAAVHNITISPNGTDTIDTTSSYKLIWNFQSVYLISDGVSNWNLVGMEKTSIAFGESLTLLSGGSIQANSGSLLKGTLTTNATTINLSAASSIAIDGTSNISVASGGTVKGNAAGTIVSTVNGAIQHQAGANDWVTFSSNRARTINSNIIPLSLGSSSTWTLNQNGGSRFNAFVGVLQNDASSSSVDNAFVFDIPKHNGATIAGIFLYFIVANNSLPAVLPTLSICRGLWHAGDPASVVYLNSSDGGVGSGLPISTATSGSDWYAGGNVQSFGYDCNQNNVVDTSQYNYFGSVVGESGSGSSTGDLYIGIQVVYASIANMQFP